MRHGKPSTRTVRIREAIKAGDYTVLQEILLTQAVLLHKMGAEFIQKSTSVDQLKQKAVCADIGIRALGQSTKMLIAVKTLKG